MSIFIHPTAIVEDGAIIGDGTKIWAYSHISKNTQIGMNCVIGERVHIAPGVVIGNNCKIQNGVNLYTGVVTEDYCFFGPNCQTTNELHIGLLDEDGNPHASWEIGHTIFKRGCAIGAQSVIICGEKDNPTIIGEQAVVGSGSVVTKSVPAKTTVVGNPARELKTKSSQ